MKTVAKFKGLLQIHYFRLVFVTFKIHIISLSPHIFILKYNAENLLLFNFYLFSAYYLHISK